MKIVTVVGARPQFVKASVVSRALRETNQLAEVLIHTGQHFDDNMSKIFFRELGMSKPDYNLGIHGGGHGSMTGRMMGEIENVLLTERPDVVMVYGDTNSTMAGALAAVKLHIPVAHVEAGLRSFNMKMPEEINRIVTDRVSRWLFAPTTLAEANLCNEGVSSRQVFLIGDVMYDASLFYGGRVTNSERVLGRLGLSGRRYLLVTVHRAENTGSAGRLNAIVGALGRLAQHIEVVWPIHPRTRDVLRQSGRLVPLAEKIHLIDPVGYLDMVQLEKYAAVVATDSGGVQKEAFFHGIPCVTLRDETEWVELVEAGWNRLVAPDEEDDIVSSVLSAIGTIGSDINPYGTGDAAAKIVQTLARDLTVPA